MRRESDVRDPARGAGCGHEQQLRPPQGAWGGAPAEPPARGPRQMARPSQPLHPPHAHRLALIRTLTPTLRGMLVGRTGLSPVMVGRSAELARLRGLVGASTTPAVALVAGEAGIGKTRLVKELVDDAPDRSEEHTSELQSLMRISSSVFCFQKKNTSKKQHLT